MCSREGSPGFCEFNSGYFYGFFSMQTIVNATSLCMNDGWYKKRQEANEGCL